MVFAATPLNSPDLLVDAVFGFSFKSLGGVRPPFDQILKELCITPLPVVSIDVPSGWDVDNGPPPNQHIMPSLLVSLTAPKLGVKDYLGRHFLGGRFVPSELREKYELEIPEFEGDKLCVELRGW